MSKILRPQDYQNIAEAMKRANPEVDGDLIRNMRELDPELPARFEQASKELLKGENNGEERTKHLDRV